MDNTNPLYTIKEGAVLQRAFSANGYGRAAKALAKNAANIQNRNDFAQALKNVRKSAINPARLKPSPAMTAGTVQSVMTGPQVSRGVYNVQKAAHMFG